MNKYLFFNLLKELVGLYLKIDLNNIKNQKKFYCDNKTVEILIKSKSKKKLSKINLQKEIEKLDKEINLDIIIEYIEYFKNFKGFIILFEFNASINRFEERGDMLGIAFFNQSLIDFDMAMFRLFHKVDFETIKFVLNLFFIEDKSIKINNWLKWKDFFYDSFYEIVRDDLLGVFIYEDTKVKFIEFKDLNGLVYFLNRFEFK